MDLIVFTNSSRVRDAFRIGKKNRHVAQPVFLRTKELKKALKTARVGTLVYLDVTRMNEKIRRSALRELAREQGIIFGAVDADNAVKDPAQVFHSGAVDYVNRKTLAAGITAKRITRITGYLTEHRDETVIPSTDAAHEAPRIPASDWKDITPGREYTFYLLFIEIDGKEEMEKRYDRSNLKRAVASVRSYIERFAASYGGRIWMWADFNGIILFPFNGSESPAVRFALRFMLFKHFYDLQESQFPNFLSYRIAIHMGNLAYSDNNKGHIVSDTLNSVFHMGKQFARPGNFYVTAEVLKEADKRSRDFFVEAGLFEGRKMLRMRHPLHSGRQVEEL